MTGLASGSSDTQNSIIIELHMMISNLSAISLLCIGCVVASGTSAELSSLSDEELSTVNGQGVGFVLEDFVFSHGHDATNNDVFKITGIKSTAGEDVEITVSQLYIARGAINGDFTQDSNYGQNLSPVNLGRLGNPFEVDVLDGNDIGINDKAVLQLAAPEKVDATVGYDCISASAAAGSGTCSSRPGTTAWQGERFDTGLMMNVQVGAKSPDDLNVHAKSAVIDGSYLRLWAGEDIDDPSKTQLVAEYRLNFYTPELSINTCDATGQNCSSRITMSNFALELALGNALQPMYLDVTNAGNFAFQVKNIRSALPGSIGSDGLIGTSDATTWNAFNEYYTDPNGIYKSNVNIGELSVGSDSYGSSRVEGMLIQYLNIESHDL